MPLAMRRGKKTAEPIQINDQSSVRPHQRGKPKQTQHHKGRNRFTTRDLAIVCYRDQIIAGNNTTVTARLGSSVPQANFSVTMFSHNDKIYSKGPRKTLTTTVFSY